MSKTGKIVLWITIATVVIAGGLGTYFLIKPKEGQTKIGKDGKSYTFTNGKWIEGTPEQVNIQNPTTSGTTSGGGSGKKLCYDELVEKLQTKLKSEGASIDVDGCMGTDTKNEMEKYGYTISGNKILKTIKVAPAKNLGLWTATDSVYVYGSKKLSNGMIDINLDNKNKISKSNVFIGAVSGFKALTYGTYGSMNLIVVIDNKGNTLYVHNQNNVISKKPVEV